MHNTLLRFVCVKTWTWGICVFFTLLAFARTVKVNLEHQFYVVQIRQQRVRMSVYLCCILYVVLVCARKCWRVQVVCVYQRACVRARVRGVCMCVCVCVFVCLCRHLLEPKTWMWIMYTRRRSGACSSMRVYGCAHV